MNDPREHLTFGPTPEGTTHWGLARLGSSGLKGEPEKYRNAEGLVVNRWPLAELTVDEVRKRWGQGRYQVQWFALDGSSHAPRGKGFVFELAANDEVATEAPASDPLSQLLAIQQAADARAARETDRVFELLAQLRGVAPGTPAAPGAEESAELRRLREENAELRMRAAMREEAERVAAPLRAELAERDRRIASLERESDRETDDGGPFEAGAPIIDTLIATVLNKAASNPEAVAAVLGPLVALMTKKPEQVAAPPPDPTPPPPQVAAAPSVRPKVVRFPVQAPPEPAASPYGPATPIADVAKASPPENAHGPLTPIALISEPPPAKPDRIVELDEGAAE